MLLLKDLGHRATWTSCAPKDLQGSRDLSVTFDGEDRDVNHVRLMKTFSDEI